MSVRLTDDDRYAVASRAEAGARANHPTHLVALAMLVLAVTIIVALFAWRADHGAAKDLRNKATDLAGIRDRAARLVQLETESQGSNADNLYAPIPDVLSRLGSLATEAGLASIQDVPRTSNDAFAGARRVNYSYTVRDQSADKLIAWAQLATERIPGMQIRRISLKPGPTSWVMDLTLARFERVN